MARKILDIYISQMGGIAFDQPWLEKILKYVCLKWLELALNCSPFIPHEIFWEKSDPSFS